MKLNTSQKKKASGEFERVVGKQEIVNQLYKIIQLGIQWLDEFIIELGVIVVIAVLDVGREEPSVL